MFFSVCDCAALFRTKIHNEWKRFRMEEKSQRCEPARLSASQVMTSPATQPVKSPVDGLRRVTCYNSQSASRKVSPVNYNQLSAGRTGRGLDGGKRGLPHLFEKQPCLYDTSLNILFHC